MLSYKFPSSGIGLTDEYGLDEVIDICTTLCELAQLSSEQIQKVCIKEMYANIEKWGETESNLMNHRYRYNGIIDPEDFYRINYLRRKQPYPVSIYYTMTEGMAEDYFRA